AAAGRTVRIGNEPVRGLVGAAQVASRDLDAGQVEFAGHPDRHRLQRVVEDADGHAGDGSAHGRGVAVCHGRHERVHRVLGGPVAVDGAGGGEGAQAAPQVLGAGFPTEAEEVRQVPHLPGVEQAAQVGGGEVEVVDAVGGDVGAEAGVVVDVVVAEQVEFVAVEQAEQLVPGRVETERPGVADPQALRGRTVEQDVAVGGDQVGEGPVRDDDALRLPRGSGGVDEVGRVVGVRQGQ